MNYLAVYKGPADDLAHKFSHWSVCLWTKSKYSHCEIVIDGYGYSASARDKGVRKKKIDFNSGKWDLIPLPSLDVEHVKQFFAETEGMSYDWIGLGWFVAHFIKDGKSKWFCSEWCARAMNVLEPQKQHIQNLVDLMKWSETH